jgi:hypothetical protein
MLPFDDAAVNALRRARMLVGADLRYLDCTLPAPDNFPVWEDLLGCIATSSKPSRSTPASPKAHVLALVDSRLETFEKAQVLVKFLDEPHGVEGQVGWYASAVAGRAWPSGSPTCSRRPVLQALLAVAPPCVS